MLLSITVTPISPSIAKGTTVQLTATGAFSDGSTQDLTASVSWTSKDNATATVSPSGVVTGNGAGTTTITATREGVSGSTSVRVTLAVLTQIVVTPANPTVFSGHTLQLTATGLFSDGSTQNLTNLVNWTSSMPFVASVSRNGLVRANPIHRGTTIVTATLVGLSGNTTVTVPF